MKTTGSWWHTAAAMLAASVAATATASARRTGIERGMVALQAMIRERNGSDDAVTRSVEIR